DRALDFGGSAAGQGGADLSRRNAALERELDLEAGALAGLAGQAPGAVELIEAAIDAAQAQPRLQLCAIEAYAVILDTNLQLPLAGQGERDLHQPGVGVLGN